MQREDSEGTQRRRTVRPRPAAWQLLVNATETAQAVCLRLELPQPDGNVSRSGSVAAAA